MLSDENQIASVSEYSKEPTGVLHSSILYNYINNSRARARKREKGREKESRLFREIPYLEITGILAIANQQQIASFSDTNDQHYTNYYRAELVLVLDNLVDRRAE